jgi:hypothetical protein
VLHVLSTFIVVFVKLACMVCRMPAPRTCRHSPNRYALTEYAASAQVVRTLLVLLLQPVGGEASDDIDKDLGRTFPTTKRFAAAEGQDALRRVLRAYAAFDPEVGQLLTWGFCSHN